MRKTFVILSALCCLILASVGCSKVIEPSLETNQGIFFSKTGKIVETGTMYKKGFLWNGKVKDNVLNSTKAGIGQPNNPTEILENPVAFGLLKESDTEYKLGMFMFHQQTTAAVARDFTLWRDSKGDIQLLYADGTTESAKAISHFDHKPTTDEIRATIHDIGAKDTSIFGFNVHDWHPPTEVKLLVDASLTGKNITVNGQSVTQIPPPPKGARKIEVSLPTPLQKGDVIGIEGFGREFPVILVCNPFFANEANYSVSPSEIYLDKGGLLQQKLSVQTKP